MKISLANLQAPVRRAKLPCRHAHYWVGIGERGKCIGYRRALPKEPGVWSARLYLDGRWIQKHLGLADDFEPSDATRILSLLQAKAKAILWFPTARNEAEGHVPQPKGKYKVSDALIAYFAECRGRGLKEGNIYRQECSARAHIQPTLGSVPVESLTITRIKKWMADAAKFPARKRSRKGSKTAYRAEPVSEDRRRARRDSINRVFSTLKATLNLAVANRKVPFASAFAWREVKPFRATAEARTLFLTNAEQKSLLAACEGDFADLVRAGLYCGARYRELCNLMVRNYDTAKGSLYIAPHTAKNGKARHIHLDLEAQRFFADLSAHRNPDEPMFLRKSRGALPSSSHVRIHAGQWGQSEQSRLMKTACIRAGFKPFPFYTLRHSCSARWLAAGAPMAYVAAQLGNSVAICQKYYGQVSNDRVAEVMNAMPPIGLTLQRFPDGDQQLGNVQ